AEEVIQDLPPRCADTVEDAMEDLPPRCADTVEDAMEVLPMPKIIVVADLTTILAGTALAQRQRLLRPRDRVHAESGLLRTSEPVTRHLEHARACSSRQRQKGPRANAGGSDGSGGGAEAARMPPRRAQLRAQLSAPQLSAPRLSA